MRTRRFLLGALVSLCIIGAVFLGWQWNRGALRGGRTEAAEPVRLGVPSTDMASPAGEGYGLYLLHDGQLGPPNATDWRQTYSGWQEVGGWMDVTWEEINPSEGVYDFSKLTAYIDAARERNRPVAFSVQVHGEEESLSKRLADWTPAWVYQSIPGRPHLDGRPVGYQLQPGGCDRPAAVPLYDHPEWQKRFDELLIALADEFGDAQRYPNLKGVLIGGGFAGVDEPTQNLVCAYSAELDPALAASFDAWMAHLITKGSTQFTHPLFWVLTTPANARHRAEQIDAHAVSPIGLLIAQPRAGTPLPSPAALTPRRATIPIGWRLAEPTALAQPYWDILRAAGQGIDWLDLQWAHIMTAGTIREETGLDLLALGRTYVGVSVEDSPGVWLVAGLPEGLEEKEGADVAPNTWAFGLYPPIESASLVQMEGQSPRFGGLLLGIGAGLGTAERRDIPYLDFQVDEKWGALEEIEAGRLRAVLRVLYLDRGNDGFTLWYPAQDNLLAYQRMRKENSGQWKLAEFPLVKPAWSGESPFDLRMDSGGDGDEVVHLVEIRVLLPEEAGAATPAVGWSFTRTPGGEAQVETERVPTAAPVAEVLPAPFPPLLWLLIGLAIGILFLAARLLLGYED